MDLHLDPLGLFKVDVRVLKTADKGGLRAPAKVLSGHLDSQFLRRPARATNRDLGLHILRSAGGTAPAALRVIFEPMGRIATHRMYAT